jgi:hypothetical protein
MNEGPADLIEVACKLFAAARRLASVMRMSWGWISSIELRGPAQEFARRFLRETGHDKAPVAAFTAPRRQKA